MRLQRGTGLCEPDAATWFINKLYCEKPYVDITLFYSKKQTYKPTDTTCGFHFTICSLSLCTSLRLLLLRGATLKQRVGVLLPVARHGTGPLPTQFDTEATKAL